MSVKKVIETASFISVVLMYTLPLLVGACVSSGEVGVAVTLGLYWVIAILMFIL